jgi:hypothetical protein
MIRIKKALAKAAALLFLATAMSQSAFGQCYVACSATCSSVCHYDISGSCSDQDAYYLILHCCDAETSIPGLPPCDN